MIHIYPANLLENLVVLLDKVSQAPSRNLLDSELVLVQSKGMQHWLNLCLARQRGISMNLQFTLPVQFVWQLTRDLLGPDRVPERSPYAREILTWRLYQLLASDAVVNDPGCVEPTRYWLEDAADAALKRFELAGQLADLYEQYLIFRPDWIDRWDAGQESHWQALLWRQLVAQSPDHPVRLLRRAADRMAQAADRLPERISLFGINTLPPLWLQFFSRLGQQIPVHLFHLNPCVEYWGELQSDKQLAQQFARWGADAGDTEPANPLLANLGGQGRDFLRLLQDHSGLEFPVFEPPAEWAGTAQGEASLLQQIQQDILLLEDARQAPRQLIDESITLVSAHSALREIQGLHDWLLHRFNEDPSLTPKDVLVMCPQIEHYAPYVEAVFARGWDETDESSPPLPCSIADRSLKDSEPLVHAFTELLELPDSRFQVSQVMGYIRLPAMAERFRFAPQDLLLLERWLNAAAIHWGLDADHKGRLLGLDCASNRFSWQQGLVRLLLGFAQGDRESIYQEQLLLPEVEGQQAELLGRLIQLLEQLDRHRIALQTPRTISQWKHYLSELKADLFAPLAEDQQAQQMIEQAIDDLSEFARAAGFDDPLPLAVVREFLNGRFSQPEPGRQFLAGQVTFCSMIPMRSVPFRIIAVLGLNDGEFPRQRIPMGFDLMAKSPPRPGDRSRRGDDRYLFLEALVSAREKLYLSYQGREVKTNEPRQPSLVLRELKDYLRLGYRWPLDDAQATPLRQLPMQPFSPANFQGDAGSFSSAWLKLSQPATPRQNQVLLPPQPLPAEPVPLEQLVRFFDNPARALARERLRLFLGEDQGELPDDSEPFTTNHLDRYQLQDGLVSCLLEGEPAEALLTRARLRGQLPDTPGTELELQEWHTQAQRFVEVLQQQGVAALPRQSHAITLNLKHGSQAAGALQLEAELPLVDDHQHFWRLASVKGKDDVRLWLHHLLANLCGEQAGRVTTHGYFRADRDPQRFKCVSFEPPDDAAAQLQQWLAVWRQGLSQPLLLNAALGQAWGRKGSLDQAGFDKQWLGDWNRAGLGADPYLQWFWPEAPHWSPALETALAELYAPLYAHRREDEL